MQTVETLKDDEKGRKKRKKHHGLSGSGVVKAHKIDVKSVAYSMQLESHCPSQ